MTRSTFSTTPVTRALRALSTVLTYPSSLSLRAPFPKYGFSRHHNAGGHQVHIRFRDFGSSSPSWAEAGPVPAMRALSLAHPSRSRSSLRSLRAGPWGTRASRQSPHRRATRPSPALFAQRGPHDLTAKRCRGHTTFWGVLNNHGYH